MSMPTGTCFECRDSFELPGYDRDYCSYECYLKGRGESIFEQVRNDHTRCSTCWGLRKRISPPTEEWKHRKGSAYQLALDNGGTLEKHNGKQVLNYTEVTGTRPVDVDSVVGFEYDTEIVFQEHGLKYCQCGNVDHFGESEEIRNVNPNEVIQNLWSLLVEYYKKGQFGDNKPNQELLIEGLKESGLDYQYASGKCVYE